ncbi:MAG: glycosyltransferase family 2 protein [Bacteroidota bacterium]
MTDSIIEKPIHNRNVSVVMATCNGGLYLEEQIQSILLQTLQPAEFIVCDDQSTDNTPDILEKYSRHGVLQYVINTKRLGITANFKKAVSLASHNNYVALSDQDDIWMPEKLAVSVTALQKIDTNTDPAMIYSDLLLMNKSGQLLDTTVQAELGHTKYIHCLETLLFGNFVLGCTVVMNPEMKKHFATIPENSAFNHDTWITLLAFTLGKVYALPDPYIYYRHHDSNATFSNHRKQTRMERILSHLKNTVGRNDYLAAQFVLVKAFYSHYSEFLSAETGKMIKAFLKLEQSPYLRKKIAFEKAFNNKWISRF